MIGQLTKGKDLWRYAAMPQIKPRLAQLFGSGFQQIAFFIALVFLSVRLLPMGHPYTRYENIGRFGMRQVIAAAANNLVLSRDNVDQIILFVSILVGMVLLFGQIVLFVAFLLFQPALAAETPGGYGGFFGIPADQVPHDVAYMMLDMVFGIPDVFGSCISTPALCEDLNGNNYQPAESGESDLTSGGSAYVGPYAPGASVHFPFPVHRGLHQLFQIYSLGLLIVAVIISTYFIITILAETAQTGTPFGKRFNKVWAPLRFVVAFGLLVPVGYGLNSAQYIVLYAAKFGSNFATNAWTHFNEALMEENLGQTQRLVSTPNVPQLNNLLQFYFIAQTCAEAERVGPKSKEIKPYIVKGPLATVNAKELPTTGKPMPYEEMHDFADGSNKVTIRYGERLVDKNGKPKEHAPYKGYVRPYCGEVVFSFTDNRNPAAENAPEPGAEALQRYYWYMIQELWNTNPGEVLDKGVTEDYPENFVVEYMPSKNTNKNGVPSDKIDEKLPAKDFPDLKQQLQNFYKADLEYVLVGAEHPFGKGSRLDSHLDGKGPNALKIQEEDWEVPDALRRKGWGAAGIWYNRIAEMNGAVTTSVFNVPTATHYPEVMEYVLSKKLQGDNDVTFKERFSPILQGNKDLPFNRDVAVTLNEAYLYWADDDSDIPIKPTGNIIIDTINAMFGLEGLFNMRKNTDVHPLAQLVGVGRSLIESTIQTFGYAVVGGSVQNAFRYLDDYQSVGKAAGVAASFFVTIAMVGLTVGFVLFYIVPILPFLYFFFAVSGWVKGVFEAMVGVPLWALAHIRIDGEGLPGQAAMNGYYLIFEIFLRPILIVFGLLAGIMTFAALVTVLNQIFDLVTSNLAGFDSNCKEIECGFDQIEFYRSPVDQFFFTILYTVVVYLMGMSSFKLIDLIPNNILRWMGQSVQTFNDSTEDPVQGLVGKASLGTQQLSTAVGGGLKGLLAGR